MMSNKRGVSLVAVLLFMLIATIAGTATYKWLSSAGGSSASRLHMREAEYAAKSGIESAHSWMTYHGAETGAIIRQFLKNKRPILLDSLLNPIKTDKEQYSVWFIGANVENRPYQIKLLSFGQAAGGSAKYSKSAILNVDGLYRVKVPQEPKAAPFKEALFSGNVNGHWIDVSSGVINGTLDIDNYVNVRSSLVVTGDMIVNSDTKVKDLYVYGNLISCTNFDVTNDAYIGGFYYVNGINTFGHDLYAAGGINMSTEFPASYQGKRCNTGAGTTLTVGGNTSVNGDILAPRHNAEREYTFKGNLVAKNDSKIIFPDVENYRNLMVSQPYTMKFLGNVYLGGGIDANGFHVRYKDASKVVFGSTGKKVYSKSSLYRITDANGLISSGTDYYSYWVDNEVYTQNANVVSYRNFDGNITSSSENLPSNTFCNRPDCAPTNNNGANFWKNNTFYNCSTQKTKSLTDENGITTNYSVGDPTSCVVSRNEIFFQVNGNYVSSLSPADTSGWGAEPMSDYTNAMIDGASGNCGGPHMKEPLQFNKDLLNSRYLLSSDNKGACAGITSNPTWDGGSLWAENNSADRWALLEQCYTEAKKAKQLYDDKWLLIKIKGNQTLSNLSSSTVLTHNYIIIMQDSSSITLPPTSADANVMMYLPNGGGFTAEGKDKTRNYFVFSDKDVDFNTAVPISGSLFLTDCHVVNAPTSVVVDYNSTMTGALSESAVLCENDGTGKCLKNSDSGSSDGSSGAYDSFTDGNYDQYFVPVAPQLLLTVQSEYKSTKKDLSDKSGMSVDKSLLVMPRIIYLPSSPKGMLSDYYDIVNLNGATEVKDPNKVYCNPTGIITSEKFSSSSDTLKSGVYKCLYRSEGYDDALFYVVVDAAKTASMDVHFDTNYVEIAKGLTVDVPIVVPAGGASSQPISVDVYVTKADGWTITPSAYAGSPTTNSNGSQVYKLTLNPGEDEQKLNVFQVTMPNVESASRAVTFQLIPPCDGCTIIAPQTLTVAASGTVEIERKEISRYCEIYPDNCKKEDGSNKYYSVIMAPSCYGANLLKTGDNWIYAAGANCVGNPVGSNDSWFCNMNTPVRLMKKNVRGIEQYCDIVIPLLDNSFSATKDGEKGTLYGTIARKTKYLTVSVVGSKNANTAVYVRKSSNINATEPDDMSLADICLSGNTCQFVAYPGYRYFFYASAGSTDDKFSYFKCTGQDCPDGAEIMSSNPYELSVQRDDNTIVARFNDKDDHCLYEDFAPDSNGVSFGAFCGRGQTRCIDTCSVKQSAGNSCSVTGSAVANDGSGEKPDWVMVYNNAKPSCPLHDYNYERCSAKIGVYIPLGCEIKYGKACTKPNGAHQLAPVIANNYITANSNAYNYSFYENGTQAVILSTKDAGFNGTLTSLFTTAVQSIPNSGFIFRSNDDASEYFSLSLYGKARLVSEKWTQNASQITARLCYVRGQKAGQNSVSDKCVEKDLELDEKTLGSLLDRISSSTSITMVLTIKGNAVSAAFTLDRVALMDGKQSVSFDLEKDFGVVLADPKHNRVGFKLSDNHFNVHDISWMSENYKGDCWAAPKIVCSFKSNYLGGMVPKEEEVTPWVGYSSFLKDDKYRNCELKYYYNGCDMDFGGFVLSWDSKWNDLYRGFSCALGDNKLGTYWDVGSPVEDGYYNFKDEGKHGYAVAADGGKQAGIAKDGKVLLDCSKANVEPPSSLSAHQTCGEFLVGQMEYCSENYEFIRQNDAVSCSGGCIISTTETVDGSAKGANLRDASLEFSFDNADGAEIQIVLVDDGNKSSELSTTTGTSYSLDVNTVSSVDGFNPQNITEIRITSEGSVGVYSVLTNCPYALGVTSCTASYDGISWIINADVVNAYSCDVEPPSSLDTLSKKTGVTCGSNSTFTFENANLLNEVTSASTTYEFSVTAFNEDKSKSFRRICTTTTEIKPITLSCELEQKDGSDYDRVMKGTGVPGFSFTFANCDQFTNGKCNYEVSLENVHANGSTNSGTSQYSGATSPFDKINRPGTALSGGESYQWLVKGPANTSCYKTFSVYESNSSATGDLCSVDKDGIFYAEITSDGVWSASVSISSSTAHPKYYDIGKKTDSGDGDFTVSIPKDYLDSGDYVVLVINGERSCFDRYKVERTPSSDTTSVDTTGSESQTTGKTICLVGKSSTDRNVVANMTAGTYTLKHNCVDDKGWWVYCDGGDSVIVGNKKYRCASNNWSGMSLPKSPTTLVVPAGMTVTKFGCTESTNPVPAGCAGHENELIDNSPTPSAGKKTICIASNYFKAEETGEIGVGKYGLVQNCYPTFTYNCTGNVKYQGSAWNCDGGDHDVTAPLYGSLVPELEVMAGGKVNNLKCAINQYAMINPSCPVTGVVDDDPPSYTGNSSDCRFDKSSYSQGETANYKYSNSAGYWTGREFELLGPSGSKVAEGTMGSGNQTISVQNVVGGTYSLYLKSYSYNWYNQNMTVPATLICKAEAVVTAVAEPPSATCSVTKSNDAYLFSANLNNCSSGCNWYLKKDGSLLWNDKSSDKINVEVSNPGRYTLHLVSAEQSAVCDTTIAEEESVGTGKCSFDNGNGVAYGTTTAFKVNGNLNPRVPLTWGLFEPNNNVPIKTGTISSGDHYSWTVNNVVLKKSGDYTLVVGLSNYCTATANVLQPRAKDCKIDGSTEYSLGYGNSAPTFSFSLENCASLGLCKYTILRDGKPVSGATDVDASWYNTYKASSAGTYTVMVNGVVSDGCSAVLSRYGDYLSPGGKKQDLSITEWQEVNGPFVAGTYKYQANKSCKYVAFYVNGASGSVTFWGSITSQKKEIQCSGNNGNLYNDFEIAAHKEIHITLSGDCEISWFKFHECN